jgi:hypothetical protein
MIQFTRMMKLVEESSGIGTLMFNDVVVRQVRYNVSRFQGMMETGLPIPGVHRIEGSIELNPDDDTRKWMGGPLRLKLEDGRVLGITLVDGGGRILNEGHGPSKCLCC